MNNPKHPPDPNSGSHPGQNYGTGYGYGYGYGAAGDRAGDFARTWHTLVEKAWIVVLTMAVTLALGYVYIRRATVIYSATATIQAEEDQLDILKMQSVQFNRDIQAVDYLQTVAQSLTSRPLLQQVADTNQLWTNPRFITGPNNTNHSRILTALEGMVQVKLRRGTRLIDVTVKHPAPELTEQIANSIVSVYVNSRAQRSDSSIGQANESLSRETDRLRKKLEQSENALQAYREENKATSLDDRPENTVVAKLKELSTKATEAKSIRIKIETEYGQVLNLGTNIQALLTVPSVAGDQTVLTLQARLTQAENDFAGLVKRYKEKHPKYVQATTQIAELQVDVHNAVGNAVKTLKASLDSATAAEQALEAALRSQEIAALELSKLSIQYSVLAREVESDRALYDAVLKGMKEAWVAKETQQTGVIRQVAPAYLPELPISPKKTAIMAMAGLAGLFLGVFIVAGLRATDTSIKTVDDAETVLGLSVVSVVPHMNELRNGHSRLVVAENARSEAAEAFRTLRTSLSTLSHSEERRVSLFTSAMPSEGKTFCSVNYAASLAQLGRKTLLIDADLRKPAVEVTLLGQQSDHSGITDYLIGQKKLAEVIQPTKVPNLFFISGGITAANPAELLGHDGLNSLIQEALENYDHVVIDSAPINAVSDTLLMLKSVHTVCLVVRAAATSSRYVFRSVKLLQGADAALAGIVLNRMPRNRRFGYGAYYDYQHHGKYGKNGVYGDH